MVTLRAHLLQSQEGTGYYCLWTMLPSPVSIWSAESPKSGLRDAANESITVFRAWTIADLAQLGQ